MKRYALAHSYLLTLAVLCVLQPGIGACSALAPAEPAKAPCDTETAAKLATQCAAEAALCMGKGGTEKACGAICDQRADERASQCR